MFNDLQKLYDCIRDVITTCDDMDLKIESVDKLKEAYNNLCEEEGEEI